MIPIARWRALPGWSRPCACSRRTSSISSPSPGLRGRGGAAFPDRHQVAARCSRRRRTQKYVVCNADEGDSGTFADRMLMEGDPLALIEGMTIAGLAVGATQGYIYLRSRVSATRARAARGHRTARVAAATWATTSAAAAGRSSSRCGIGAGAYICGEETALLESLEGKRGMVRAKPPLPAVAGPVRPARPWSTTCSTAGRGAAASWRAAPAFYRDFGTGRSRGTLRRPAGGQHRARRPGRDRLRRHACASWSTTSAAAPPAAGPIRADPGGRPARRLPAGDRSSDTAARLRGVRRDRAPWWATAAWWCSTTPSTWRSMARFAMEFCALESCGKCTPCRIGSTRGVEVIDRIVAGETAQQQHRAAAATSARRWQHGSLCAMGGMTPYPVLQRAEALSRGLS
ncbi:MAG: formate dehydrogenase [Comamonadaceae bacterium]|nr:formate dehydrogenase [Comamonadaceae bacterium]